MVCHGAGATEIRECTTAESDGVDHMVAWNSREDHRLFALPKISYDRPEVDRLGFGVVVVVDAAGRVTCLDPRWAGFGREMATTPQRRAVLRDIATWRFKPYLVDGKPAAEQVHVFVPETVDFKYHEAMPVAAMDATSVRLQRSGCMG